MEEKSGLHKKKKRKSQSLSRQVTGESGEFVCVNEPPKSTPIMINRVATSNAAVPAVRLPKRKKIKRAARPQTGRVRRPPHHADGFGIQTFDQEDFTTSSRVNLLTSQDPSEN